MPMSHALEIKQTEIDIRDLGVILDQELSFAEHISSLTRSCFYQLRQLRVVSRSLSSSSTATLVHAFILNRLDYCSSLCLGLPLDGVLRAATRLIGSPPSSATLVNLCGIPFIGFQSASVS